MVWADSCRISRVRHYLGTNIKECLLFKYRTLTLCGVTSQTLLLNKHHASRHYQLSHNWPHNTAISNDQNLTLIRFGLLPVRSSLLRESLTISFPLVTEIFHFTRSWYFTLTYSEKVSPFGHLRLQAVFGTSSQLIAAKYVLLPLFYSRHPFYTLNKICCNLQNKIYFAIRINVIYYTIVLNTLNYTKNISFKRYLFQRCRQIYKEIETNCKTFFDFFSFFFVKVLCHEFDQKWDLMKIFFLFF